jgi:activating signal cointegrator complex subunit 3
MSIPLKKAYDLENIPTQLLKLLIIDEVHLLSEERGAVIEAIVARTLRQVLLIET